MVPTVFWGKLIASSLLEISHGLDPDHGSARGLISLKVETGADLLRHRPIENRGA
jgi:hypothetical protein